MTYLLGVLEASISRAEGSFAIEIRAATSEGAQVVLDPATTLAQRPRWIDLATNEGARTTDRCGVDSIDAAR